MAKNRNSFEKHQRDAKKKRKAEDKLALKRKKQKDSEQDEGQPIDTTAAIDEPTEN
ncbi:MAG: hypothetical protein H6822_35715 [Planctomycetaceae bacterium]|nr:hypothetical protein [Planctomycetales bacterium]MCB9927537.1 hypothetical protein [Planctomycetaceae bacterium]